MKSKKKNNIISQEVIDPTPMSSVMAVDFNRYAKAVLQERAIPDVRDGMKPVQRRIIYGMYKEGNTFDKQTRKSATTVGYVMGHFHPHGDSSIYDALVRLSQDWKMEVPLVTMQGNNGSIDNDPAAASRYTEAKLSKIASLLVQDIEKNTVDMSLNFSDEEFEPNVLPARFPNLLVNGAQGIAVGAVTNIPTHNLGEVIDATIYAIEHKRATVSDLRQFILGPDFPTGGYLDQPGILNKLYETGQGSFYINSSTTIDRDKNWIIIDSVPYGVIKSDFVAALDNARINLNIDNVLEVRDESTEQVRIVIEVKPNQDPDAILSFYRKKGLLKTTFSSNMLAIDKGHPRTMNLLDIIKAYIDHQVDVYIRRSTFDLDRSKKRLNVVHGLIKSVDIIDELVEIIKASKGKQNAKENIMARFGFDQDQAEAIVMLNLYKINSLDYKAYVDEKTELEKNIADLERILSDRDYLDRCLINDLKAVKKEFATPRRTQILDSEVQVNEIDVTKLIAKEDVMVVITRDGYVKRTNMRSYLASICNDPCKDFPKLKQGDGLALCMKCSTHDGLIAFLNTGNYVYIPVYNIPEMKWKEEGKHLNILVKNLSGEERIVSCYNITTFDLPTYFVLATKRGKIKRTLLKEFEQKKLTPRSIKAMGITGDDELCKAELTTRDSDVILLQSNGYVSRFNESQIPVVGIKAGGVKAVDNLKADVNITDMVVLASDERVKLLFVADKEAMRIITSTSIDTTDRLGRKTIAVKVFKSDPLIIIDMEKIVKKADNSGFMIYTSDTNEIVDLDKLEASSIGCGMRSNIDLGGKVIQGVHHNSYTIDENFKLEAEKVINKEVKAEKDTQGEKQMSLFDLFKDE